MSESPARRRALKAWETMRSPEWKRSNAAHKAWKTRRANLKRAAALKAWETMRSPEWKRSNAARKAWKTRRANQTSDTQPN